MVDPAWFRRYDYADVMELRQRAVRVVVSVDTGGTKLRQISSASARTAITVWVEMEDGRCYLVDLIAEPWIYPDIIAHVKEACRQWKPTDLLIENKAAGLELIADLSEHRDWPRTPITSITPVGPKETRMAVASPQIRAGLIYLPAAAACADVPSLRCSAPAWLVDFVNEVMHFPHSRYRDISDSTSQMLNWRRENPVQGSGFSTDMTTTGARRDIEAALRGPWGARGGNSGGSGVRRIGW
jgi:predicted phage terminase large subunit-like protein